MFYICIYFSLPLILATKSEAALINELSISILYLCCSNIFSTTVSSLAFPFLAPKPLIAHSICRTPKSNAAIELSTAFPDRHDNVLIQWHR